MNEVLDSNWNDEEGPVEYATFWNRALASIVDSLALLIPSTGLTFYGLYEKSLPLVLAGAALAMVYKVWMEGTYGATLGKMAVKIKMINSARQPISLGESLQKNLIYVISQVIGMLSMIELFGDDTFTDTEGMLQSMALMNTTTMSTYGSLWSLLIIVSVLAVLFSGQTKQTLHDMIAGTYCVKTEQSFL